MYVAEECVFSLIGSRCSCCRCWTAAACGAEATRRRRRPRPTRSVLIKDVPFVVQEPDFCGEACAAMYLQKLGRRVDQDYVFNQSGLDPLQGRGCYTKELAAALTKIGFRIGPVWYRMPARDAAQAVEAQWRAVHADLLAGIPSIVCMHYNDQPDTTEHFRLVLGYDAAADTVIYHEPAQAGGAYRHMPRATFLKLWPLAGGGGQPRGRHPPAVGARQLAARAGRRPRRSRPPITPST